MWNNHRSLAMAYWLKQRLLRGLPREAEMVRGGRCVNPVVLPLRICNLRLDFWQRFG
jgi:hypothetical protein